MVDVDNEVAGAELPKVFEETLLLAARLALAATLPDAGPENLFLGDIGKPLAPKHEPVAKLSQADLVHNSRCHVVALEEVH